MRKIDFYVENRKIELFDNEQIVVNSTVQNISDISSVFTDYVNTFTIPSTPINDSIFEYYYNNDLVNQIDHNLSRNSHIEIDGVIFKTGKIRIEKAEVKGGVSENYSVSFDGDLVTFKDLVKDDKLKALDFTSLNHAYNGQEIQDRIEGIADYDVCYPLISSSRVWQYGDLTTNDINTAAGAIVARELFPAVRVSKILDLIQSRYSVVFSGSWLSSEKITQSYLYFKNRENTVFYSEPVDVVFGVGNPDTDFLYDSIVQYKYAFMDSLLLSPSNIISNVNQSARVQIITAATCDYYLDIYINGVYHTSQLGSGSYNFWIYFNLPNIDAPKNYSFKIRSTNPMTFTGDVYYLINYMEFTGMVSLNQVEYYTESITSASTTLTTDIGSFAPDMGVLDFMKGLYNMFNLTAFGIAELDYKIQPVDLFYNSGIDRNITTYITDENFTIERPKLYKNIKFEYQKSVSVLNMAYFDLFGKEYGNLTAQFDFDGGDFAISLPFENLMHQRFDNTALQVGYCVGTSPEYKNYIPKPIILFRNSLTSIGSGGEFFFNNGTTTDSITSYVPFGQDYNEYSLNFGSDISTFTNEIVTKSLYQQGYEDYLANLYNKQTRQVRAKANFPLSTIVDLKLNDSLIIRDKKYIINDVQQNILNGEVSLSLLSNWRITLDYNSHFYIYSPAQSLSVYFSIPSDITITIGACIETQFATPDITTLNDECIAVFSCTENTLGINRTNTFPLSFSGITIPNQFLVITQSPITGYIILESAIHDKLLDEEGNKILFE
jgi:hypothetical protein